jgi:NifB/MoaA-like Fe-S oxidoreductase
VGNAVEHAFQPIVQRLNQVQGLDVELLPLASRYWGQEISVTGLITGQDLLEGLQGRSPNSGIVVPSVMLKQGDSRFLDDMTVEDIANALNTPLFPVDGVEELIETFVGDRILQTGHTSKGQTV